MEIEIDDFQMEDEEKRLVAISWLPLEAPKIKKSVQEFICA